MFDLYSHYFLTEKVTGSYGNGKKKGGSEEGAPYIQQGTSLCFVLDDPVITLIGKQRAALLDIW
jgi:hypothetical protein